MILINDYKLAVDNIRNEMYRYFKEAGLESVVLGISGGIDSALVAALARPVCDELGIELIGSYISINSNKREKERADAIGAQFCTNYDSYILDCEYDYMSILLDWEKPANGDDKSYRIRAGNMKARMRMIALYNAASAHRGLVLSTNNYTELMLGFWTLHGDVGDFGPIQNLWKTEVYNMVEYLADNELNGASADALRATLTADATDGLGITKTDLDQILPNWRDNHETTRSGYFEVDMLIDLFINYGKYPKNDKKIISDRIKATEFKRNNPYNIERGIIDKNVEFKKAE